MHPSDFVSILTKPRAQRNAIESPLLRLPPEIRKKIWTFAVHVDRVLVALKEHCFETEQDRVTKGGAVAVEDDGAIASPHPENALGERCCLFHQLGAFHLPEVCRQVYIETSTLAYSSNIFLVGDESLLCKSWATKMILLAQRDAISRVELKPCLLGERLLKDYEPIYPLRRRGFRNLTHIHVSFHTQKRLMKEAIYWVSDYAKTDTSKLLAWCEAKLKKTEGSDIVVVFEQDNTPGTDSYTTLSEILSLEKGFIGMGSGATGIDDETTDTDTDEDED
jgi:hypothetical protein